MKNKTLIFICLILHSGIAFGQWEFIDSQGWESSFAFPIFPETITKGAWIDVNTGVVIAPKESLIKKEKGSHLHYLSSDKLDPFNIQQVFRVSDNAVLLKTYWHGTGLYYPKEERLIYSEQSHSFLSNSVVFLHNDSVGIAFDYRYRLFRTTNFWSSSDTVLITRPELRGFDERSLPQLYFSDKSTGYLSVSHFPKQGSGTDQNLNLFFSTSDGGENWSLIHEERDQSFVHDLRVFDQGVVIRQKRSQLEKSEDGGETWNTIFSSSGEIGAFDFLDANVGLVAVNDTLFLSHDSGNSWSISLTTNKAQGVFSSPKITCVDIVSENVVYLIMSLCLKPPSSELSDLKGLILRSTNGGRTPTVFDPWEVLSSSQEPPQEFLEVFPNPTKGRLQLHGKLAGAEMTVFDSKGKAVSELEKTGGQDRVLSLEKLPPGLYFLHIRDKSGLWVKKVMKE